jgi:RimJ/RimL family protein N-acetyltransferase
MINFGHGVTLVPVLEKQLGQMLVWRNDRRVWKWCRQNSVISEAEHIAWFRSLLGNQKIKMFSICDSEGNFVGVCGLTDIDRVNSRAEFSLYLGPDFQNKGLGKSALKTLVDHAFIDENLHSVWGESFADNPACNCFESIGFKLDGVRRGFYFRNGDYIDARLYSIFREDCEWSGSHLS